MISAPENFIRANESLRKKPEFRLEIEGYHRVFTVRSGSAAWIDSIDDQSLTVSDLEGGADLGELAVTIQDRRGLITADMPGFVFEGKKVQLKTGFRGLATADFIVLFTGRVDSVASVDRGRSYKFTCVDNKDALSQIIYQTGDDGQPTDSEHRRTLNAHPLDLLLNILLVQIGYDAEDVDSVKIQQYRDTVFAGIQFSFDLDSAPTAKDFIENEIMRPLGGYIWTNNLGRISVNFFYPTNVDPLVDIPERHVDRDSFPDATQSDLINEMSFRFDADSEGKFQSESVQIYGPSVDRFNQYGQHDPIESRGMRAGFQGFLLASLVSRLTFYRYGMKNLRMEELSLFWQYCRLEPGDIISASFSTIPDRAAGVIGISRRRFEVLDRSYDFDHGRVTITLIDAGFLATFGQYKIAGGDLPNNTNFFTSGSNTDASIAADRTLCVKVDPHILLSFLNAPTDQTKAIIQIVAGSAGGFYVDKIRIGIADHGSTTISSFVDVPFGDPYPLVFAANSSLGSNETDFTAPTLDNDKDIYLLAYFSTACHVAQEVGANALAAAAALRAGDQTADTDITNWGTFNQPVKLFITTTPATDPYLTINAYPAGFRAAVPVFPDATAAQRGRYMFLCGDDDKYSTGDPGNVLG